jgi:hypothetical protein
MTNSPSQFNSFPEKNNDLETDLTQQEETVGSKHVDPKKNIQPEKIAPFDAGNSVKS